ncbi:hypothetical protein [Streptomyces aureocirculatus]|uniref:hypothetical protein n=1 Tax=Streptomyces aureocirculatus TaxID=67275 RepID=UPI0012FF0B5A|nr:hypothetical protein [Streptomyces aureocirculatus]
MTPPLARCSPDVLLEPPHVRAVVLEQLERQQHMHPVQCLARRALGEQARVVVPLGTEVAGTTDFAYVTSKPAAPPQPW